MSPVLASGFIRETVNISPDNLDAHMLNFTELHEQEGIGSWTPLSNIYVIIGALLFLVALLWLVYFAFAMTHSTIDEPIWIENVIYLFFKYVHYFKMHLVLGATTIKISLYCKHK